MDPQRLNLLEALSRALSPQKAEANFTPLAQSVNMPAAVANQISQMEPQVPNDVVAQQPATTAAQMAPPNQKEYFNPLQLDRQRLLSQLEDFNKQRLSDEQSGIDDYQKSLQDYASKPLRYDLTPLAALVDQWSGGGNLLAAAQATKPQNPAERQKELLGLKKQLQDMRQGLSKGQSGLIEKQLDAVNDQIKEERLIKAAGQRQSNSSMDDESKLRNDWLKNDLTKKTQDVAVAYNKVKVAAADPSAAGDLSLIFGYMKMLDPGSTVRETEFANAQNAAGVPDQIRNMWNRAKNGERLNPSQRQDFINQAENVYSAQVSQQKQFNQAIGQTAQSLGFNPDRVVLKTMFKDPVQKNSDQPSDGSLDAEKRKRLEELRARKARGEF